MYSIAKNVQIVIAALKAHNVNQLVLSPGGTNAPFIRNIQDDDFFKCYSVVDERSALYFAIGIYLATGKPVAVCCTSAQATRNYLPGLTEAFYKHAPILAITFSKHPQYTYQEYMQAPDQTSLPKDAVKATYSLPYVSNDHDRMHCERLVNEAVLDLMHIVPGPIQLNVPMLDTELSKDVNEQLPSIKVITRYNKNDIKYLSFGDKKILIVVGENRGFKDVPIIKFASRTNTVIYVNHLSNMKNDYTIHGNLLLTCIDQISFDKYFSPDILITIGGQTGDYPLYHKLAESQKKYEHWRISEKGDIVDTYDHLTRVYECSVEDFFELYNGSTSNHKYLESWTSVDKNLNSNIELPLSAAFVAQQMCEVIPEGSIVNFSILNSLRNWNLFKFKNSVTCYCNVGAFGIDGCMSTLLGQSVVLENLCFMFIGDLSFFYDMNSLGIRHIKNNVRIILINNNGGIEFKIGGTEEQCIKTDKYIAAANHFKTASGWATNCGFDYYLVKDKSEFEYYKNRLVEKNEKPILMEIQIPDSNDSNAYISLIKQNDQRTLSLKIRTKIGVELGKIFKIN